MRHDPEDCLGIEATGRLLAIIGVMLVLLTVSVALDLAPTSRPDGAVAQWGYDRTFERGAPTAFWGAVSHWGAPWALRLALVAAAIAQLWRRRFGLAAWLVSVACVENIVAPASKHGLSRQRPEWQNPIAVEHSLSYPSGHSAAAGMLITAFVLLILVTVRSRGLQFVLIGVTVLVGTLVMASRIFLGVHYLSDVVAGYLLGSAIALLGWWMYLLCRRLVRQRAHPPDVALDDDNSATDERGAQGSGYDKKMVVSDKPGNESREVHAAAPEAGSPGALSRTSWSYIVRRTFREFLNDECPDVAAALTYYAVLALFPAFIALVSLVGLVGEDRSSVDFLLDVLRDLRAGSVADTLEPTLVELSAGSGAGLALFLGLAGALWSASGYTHAFGRAMNRVYGVREGRPVWKLRPLMLLLTAVLLILTAVTVAGLVLSGPVARSVGDALGLGGTAVSVWGILKWPVLLFIVAVIVDLLYWGTPNIKHPRFRWITVGSALAIVVWVLLSAMFGLYVANFSSFSRTYGSLAGVIVFLLWLWITNLALLFGGELDAEIERGRELQRGLPAERQVQLEPRDSRNIEKFEERQRDEQTEARKIRMEHQPPASPRDEKESGGAQQS